MHPFLAQLEQSDTWAIPTYPEPDDPSWEIAFSRSGDTQRRHIANAWLWRLNLKPQPVSKTAVINTLVKHRRMYANAAAFADKELFSVNAGKGHWDGTLEPLKSSANRDCGLVSYDLLHTFWLDPHADKEKALIALHECLCTADARYSRTELGHLTSILVWDYLEEHSETISYEAKRCVYLSSYYSHARYASKEDLPQRGVANPVYTQRTAWEVMSYYSANKTTDPANMACIIADIQKTEPSIAAATLWPMFVENVGTYDQGRALISSCTMFNPKTTLEEDLYTPLYVFIPALTSFWDTCKRLDMDPLDALEQAGDMHHAPDGAAYVTVPSSMSP